MSGVNLNVPGLTFDNYNQAAQAGLVYGPTNPSSTSPLGQILTKNPTIPATGGNNPANYVNTNSGGGSSPSLLDQLAAIGKDRNPVQESQYQDLLNQQRNSADALQAAALSSANTEFDRNSAALKNQLSDLATQKQNAFNELDTGLTGVQNQVNTSRQNAQTNTDQQIQQAGSIAHSTQDQNRRVLRALGIINSTAAGELLTKPMNEFDKQRANLNVALGQRFNELDNFMNQKAAEAKNAKDNIIGQYTSAYNQIQNDLRFNDRQRLDAIQAINAQAQQHLADIQSQLLNWQTQVNTQKQNFAMGLAQIAAYQNPSIAKDYLNNVLLSNTGQGNQTAAIYDPNKRDQNNVFR